MLEDRLSNTYSQHSLGGYRSQPAQTAMYPTIPSDPSTRQGGTESYYNMTGAPRNAHSTPQYQYTEYPPSQTSYTQRERAPSNTASVYERSQHDAQIPQRASSLQSYPQSPASQRQDSYTYPNAAQEYQQYPKPLTQPSPQTPVRNSLQDASAAYYNSSSQQQVSPPQPHPPQQADQSLGSAPSPEQNYQNVAQQQPRYPGLPQQIMPTPQQQQPYWQQLPPQTIPQTQIHTTPYPSAISFTQDSFPAAPNHQPQPKQVEEQLIEL